MPGRRKRVILMTIPEKLNALRARMAAHGMDAYVVLTDDFHASEYAGEYFKSRAWLTGFTGSAGSLAVLPDRALLWTDGRYFLQAGAQLEGTGIELMRDREPGVPEICIFLAETVKEGGVIGFDGRAVSQSFAKRLAAKTTPKHITFAAESDLVGEIWADRPALSHEPVFEVDAARVGATREQKMACLREHMTRDGVDVLVLTALDEIAWLLNLRGGDIHCTPVFLSFLILEKDRATLCAAADIFPADVLDKLNAAGVKLAPYGGIYDLLAALPQGLTVQIDPATANWRISGSLPEGVRVVNRRSPVVLLKAVKTPAEVENLRVAHHKDGVALTKFIYWLKTRVGKEPITELSAAGHLEELRKAQGYLGDSFDPIIAYGAHAAIVHYSATPESNAAMEPQGLCLADTGGQYEEGTTDVTRTVALGAVTEEEKRLFTLVLRGHLDLAAARFKHGVCGENLDILARAPLWNEGLDYLHGTGHGVGFLLGVHEGPQSIRWQLSGIRPAIPLEEGMVVSDEPGYYEAGKFGIRHENLVLVRKGEETAYGQFMYFETLTLAPFDRDAIDRDLLTPQECELLNAYHARVYAALAPELTGEERDWLAVATAPI